MMKSTITLLVALFASAAAFAPRSPAFFAHQQRMLSQRTRRFVAETESMIKEEINGLNTTAVMVEDQSPAKNEEEMTETQKLMKKVKDAGVAGIISYAAWEIGFWAISVPVVLFGYREVTGHWPDLSDKEDIAKLGAEAFAFVNFARFAVPLRIGLALSTTPWIQANIVDRFMTNKDETPEQ